MSPSFSWSRGQSPADLAKKVADYSTLVQVGILAICTDEASRAQTDMQTKAPWEDKTGNARKGLLCFVLKDGTNLVVYFVHTMDYGVSLELGKAGRYAVIVPQMEETKDQLMSRIRGLIED